MKLNVYSVYDNKALRFHRPYFLGTHLEAIRAFGETCADEKGMLAKYPADYSLFFIGTFDEETARMETLETPVQQIASAAEFQRRPSQPVLENGLNEAGKTYLPK